MRWQRQSLIAQQQAARGGEIATRAAFGLAELRYDYPSELLGDETAPQRLSRLAYAGLAWRYPQGAPERVQKQMAHELTLISKLRYEPYFLTVHDIVDFARQRGILCQGRGSAANSLVGSTTNDRVGEFGVTVLSNGNYVVNSPSWSNGAATQAGAVTWGSGTTGVSGAVSAANSLVGATSFDQVGLGGSGGTGVVALDNGNYVVGSPFWTAGSATEAGAVTFGSGTTGIMGTVSAAKKLYSSRSASTSSPACAFRPSPAWNSPWAGAMPRCPWAPSWVWWPSSPTTSIRTTTS